MQILQKPEIIDLCEEDVWAFDQLGSIQVSELHSALLLTMHYRLIMTSESENLLLARIK